MQRGQSLVEFGAVVPVLILLFLGALDVNVYISDSVTAQAAARQAARLASVLGGQNCVPSGSQLTQGQVDHYVAQDALAVVSKMAYAKVTDIYVYDSDSAYGLANLSSVENTHFQVTNGSLGSSSSNFPLGDRNQTVGSETSIGVEVDWAYQPPTGLGMANLSRRTWAVFKATAVPSGC